jgi:hypothetical protein
MYAKSFFLEKKSFFRLASQQPSDLMMISLYELLDGESRSTKNDFATKVGRWGERTTFFNESTIYNLQ